jgi:hypothetical protein
MEHKRADRGQAYAIEGIIGAIIVVSSLALGLQAVDMSTWSNGGDEQTTVARTEIADMLDVAHDAGALQEAVTCVSAGIDPEPHPLVASTSDPSSTFGEILQNTTGQSGEQYRYRIAIDYPTGEDSYNTTQIGPTPPEQDRATVTVSRYVTLTDTDPVFEVEDGDCVAQDETLAVEDIYIDDQGDRRKPGADDTEVYAVVRVRVTAWS